MKDKRTKGQILRLLDNALTQEELFADRIKKLETDLADCNAELADCRKKVEDPRHELTEEAMPASKVSFRVDYYRTAESGPIKGIIEHLPSRQNKAFEGEGQLIISHFMNRFLNEEAGRTKKKKAPAGEKRPEPEVAAENTDDSAALFILEQEIAAEVMPQSEAPALTAEEESVALFSDDDAEATTSAPPQKAKKSPENMEKVAPQPVEERISERGSRLLHKLKAKLEVETLAENIPLAVEKKAETKPSPPPASKGSPYVERLLSMMETAPGAKSKPATMTTVPKQKQINASMETRRPRLLQRLQEEYQRSLMLSQSN